MGKTGCVIEVACKIPLDCEKEIQINVVTVSMSRLSPWLGKDKQKLPSRRRRSVVVWGGRAGGTEAVVEIFSGRVFAARGMDGARNNTGLFVRCVALFFR